SACGNVKDFHVGGGGPIPRRRGKTFVDLCPYISWHHQICDFFFWGGGWGVGGNSADLAMHFDVRRALILVCIQCSFLSVGCSRTKFFLLSVYVCAICVCVFLRLVRSTAIRHGSDGSCKSAALNRSWEKKEEGKSIARTANVVRRVFRVCASTCH